MIEILLVEQEPCEDAISRQAVFNIVENAQYRVDAISEIEQLPSVAPKERTGHWEMYEDADGIYGVCDICGTDADFSHYGEAYPFCPNCGARMEIEATSGLNECGGVLGECYPGEFYAMEHNGRMDAVEGDND